MTDRVLPQDMNAEKSVLGSMLLGDRELVARTIENGVEPGVFYLAAHRLICRAILRVFDANETPDIITVADALQRLGALDQAGGTPYLSELSETMATGQDTRPWIKILAEYSARRAYIKGCSDITEAAHDMETPIGELQKTAEAKIFAVAAPSTASEAESLSSIVPRVRARADGYRRGIVPGIKTGFVEIDKATGGLQNSDLIIIAGRPSMGKSALAFGIALNTARRGHRPLLFLLETDKEQAAERMACMESSTCMMSLRTGRLSSAQHQQYLETCDYIHDLPVTMDDNVAQTVGTIRSRVMRTGTDLVVIDYAQLMADKGRNRDEEIGKISRGLKGIGKEFGIPVVALSQLSRAVEMRKPPRPQLSDLRESGNIEQDADLVLFVYRPEYYGIRTFNGKKDGEPTYGKAEIIIGKQRNGPTGSVKLAFTERYARFGSLTQEKEPEQQLEVWHQK